MMGAGEAMDSPERPVTDEEFFAFLARTRPTEPLSRKLLRWFVRAFFLFPWLLLPLLIADGLMRRTVGVLPCYLPLLALLTGLQVLAIVGYRKARQLWKATARGLGLHYREEPSLIFGMIHHPQIYGMLGGRPVWVGLVSEAFYQASTHSPRYVNYTIIGALLRHPMAQGEVRHLQLGNAADEPELRRLLGPRHLEWLRERAELDTLRLGAGRIALRMFESPGGEAQFQVLDRSLRLMVDLAARIERDPPGAA